MATKKTTTAKETAVKETATKAAEKKTTAKATTAKTAEKKTATKATAEKKTAAKKPAVKKTAPKKPTEKVEIFVEFGGVQVAIEDVINNVKATYGKKATDLKVYVKPEESKAYFVADGVEGEMDVYFC